MHQPANRHRPGLRYAIAALLAVCCAQLAWTASANATVQLTASTYNVSESAGQVVIVVTRTGSMLKDEYVRYGSHRLGAVQDVDYRDTGGVLHFLPLQAVATYTIPIAHYNFNGPPVNFSTYLYGSWPENMASPHGAIVSIQHDAPLDRRDPANPLELAPAPANGNPLSGATWFVDPVNDPAGLAAAQYRRSNPGWARELSIIANQPFTMRFGLFTGKNVAIRAFTYLQQAYMQHPNAVPMLSTYRIVQGECKAGGFPDTPAQIASYQDFVRQLSYGIGNFRAVLFLEMDSIITTECLKPKAQAVRLAELHDAISYLQRNPHLVVYLDGGAADAHPWQWTAKVLSRAGVHLIQGFFLNSTHFDWTTKEIAYGQKIARALGGKVHFVVNTGENGQGPLRPPDPAHQGAEVLCNPPGRGLGPKPTARTGFKWVDAFAWTSNPGERGGPCRGAPPTDYWPAYAVGLAQRANFSVAGPGKGSLIPG